MSFNFLRNGNRNPDVVITAAVLGAEDRNALAANAEQGTGLGAGRNVQLDFPSRVSTGILVPKAA